MHRYRRLPPPSPAFSLIALRWPLAPRSPLQADAENGPSQRLDAAYTAYTAAAAQRAAAERAEEEAAAQRAAAESTEEAAEAELNAALGEAAARHEAGAPGMAGASGIWS